MAICEEDLRQISRLLGLLKESAPASFAEMPPSTEARARHELVERRRRRRHFPEGLFGEPAWEILLLLYIQRGNRRFTVTALAEALDLPQNTTGRWLKVLQKEGLVFRNPHRLDQRAIIAEISEGGEKAISEYFATPPE